MLHNRCMTRPASHLTANVSKPTLPCVLVTGFDAFGGASINPSWLAAQALGGEILTGHRVVVGQLPTEFEGSANVLVHLLMQNKPRLVLCVGQAGGRNALSIERIAINIIDASIADNAGRQPLDRPVIASGPAAYFSTLPIKAMFEAVQQAGIAAEVSQTAGTFVCNHVFYTLLHVIATTRGLKGMSGGFVHVPYLAEQGSPSMPLMDMVRGLRIAIDCALTTQNGPIPSTVSAGKLN